MPGGVCFRVFFFFNNGKITILISSCTYLIGKIHTWVGTKGVANSKVSCCYNTKCRKLQKHLLSPINENNDLQFRLANLTTVKFQGTRDLI